MRADTPHYVMTQEPGPGPASIASGHSELRLNFESDKLERVETYESRNHSLKNQGSILSSCYCSPISPFFIFFVYRNAFDYCI